ncbi:MAG TPA: helix-hairpin-helix domain-containing protein [Gemmataceae bacterium]|nr:helix-hairpin-helix domain-containing protein [Gemmataceae bacterium]
MDNNAIAEWLREYARERDAEGGNLMRVRAYRRAAHLIQEMDESLEKIFDRDGRRGIRALPGIGPRIASAIESLLHPGEPIGVRRRVVQR